MKKSATATEDTSPELTAEWTAALELVADDLLRRGSAERTRRAYQSDLVQFAHWSVLEQREPAAVDVRQLRRYAAFCGESELAPSTVARKLAALRACFRTLREHGLVEQNPAELVAAPKRPSNLPRVLRPAELSALIDRIPAGTALEARDRALIELAYGSGLRAEELVSADVESLDLDGEQIRVEGKGSKTRLVPIGEYARDAIVGYLERSRPALLSDPSETALFLSKSGRRLQSSDVRRRLRLWARAAELPGRVHPHALRHSFATHLLDGGADLRAIQELLGHEHLSSTQIYTRVESARLRSAYSSSHPRA
ncbi:MAG: tyrosine recombinase [Solirubrobacteraceae bacterium]|nr:tyrosine recombinase [Solirubrobacteraceae bacterium]